MKKIDRIAVAELAIDDVTADDLIDDVGAGETGSGPARGRPGARTTCPICRSEEGRFDGWGRFACCDCGYESHPAEASLDLVEPFGGDDGDDEPIDCFDAITRGIGRLDFFDDDEA